MITTTQSLNASLVESNGHDAEDDPFYDEWSPELEASWIEYTQLCALQNACDAVDDALIAHLNPIRYTIDQFHKDAKHMKKKSCLKRAFSFLAPVLFQRAFRSLRIA
jgi:hypothetical protein